MDQRLTGGVRVSPPRCGGGGGGGGGGSGGGGGGGGGGASCGCCRDVGGEGGLRRSWLRPPSVLNGDAGVQQEHNIVIALSPGGCPKDIKQGRGRGVSGLVAASRIGAGVWTHG